MNDAIKKCKTKDELTELLDDQLNHLYQTDTHEGETLELRTRGLLALIEDAKKRVKELNDIKVRIDLCESMEEFHLVMDGLVIPDFPELTYDEGISEAEKLMNTYKVAGKKWETLDNQDIPF